jgi:cytochrome c-type biogenesis protein CcmH
MERGRRSFRRAAIILSLFCSALGAVAAATTRGQQARIERLEDAVLAPCCYTEPVSRHQSDIAIKMRLEIADWVAAGKSDQEILGTYVQRYGARVLVDPSTKPGPWMMWAPWVFAIAMLVYGGWLLRRWRGRPPEGASTRPEMLVLPAFDDEE